MEDEHVGDRRARDTEALAYVVESLALEATRCFAEAAALRLRAETASDPRDPEAEAALCNLVGRYSEAAAAWLTRLGPDALLGQAALLATASAAPAPAPRRLMRQVRRRRPLMRGRL